MPILKSSLIKINILLWFLLYSLSGCASLGSADKKQNAEFAQIAMFAEFANAAYDTQDNINRFVKTYNYQLTSYQTIPGMEVSYFLATNDKTRSQIVAVRGTANIENALVDMSVQLKEYPAIGIPLHEGFANAAEAVYEAVKPMLKQDYTVYTTGHSLGGAVAVVLAMAMTNDKHPVEKVITFGQPKVTNYQGSKAFSQLNLTRVVTEKDLVPLSPPVDPTDIYNLKVYWHLGQEIVLLDDNKYARLSGVKSMMRATNFIGEKINEQNLDYHRMKTYLALINKKITDPVEVDLKMKLNIFN